MKLKLMFAAASAVTLLAFGSANAATVGNGETFCDSLHQQTDPSSCLNLGGGDQDLGQNPTKEIKFLGDGMLKGWVRDKQGTGNELYADTAKIILTKASYVMFEIFNFDKAFKGTVSLSGVGSELMTKNNTQTGSVLVGPGEYTFVFNAADPNERRTNTTEYKLNVTAVPLPAAAWLMLAGLGGIAAVKRRKS